MHHFAMITARTAFAIVSALSLAFAVQVSADTEGSAASSADVDTALVPLVSFRGEEDTRLSIDERREALGVRAASVAVLRGGEIAWAKAYGEGVDADTLFQFASLSKPVAAAGILALARERGVGLDDDISADLTGLNLARLNPDGLPITLRGLLSHTSGTTVGGFPGYAVDEPVPTTKQVVEGAEPANSDPVVVKPIKPGERRYSGGGYTVAQYWAEQVTGEDFESVMRRLVLDPIGMKRSTFGSGTAEQFARDNVAPGYYGEGLLIPGGWRIHPEQAAASLWSTPREYLLFVRALMRAMDGDASAGIAPEVARAMTVPVAQSYGLGIGVADIDGAIRLSHSGSNIGYKSNFMAYPVSGDAVISVVNADRGWALVGDIGRTANVVYGWPVRPLITRTRLAADESELSAFIGDYAEAGSKEVAFTLTATAPTMTGTAPNGFRFELVKTGEATFIDPQDGQEGTFVEDEQGRLSVTFEDTIYVRLGAQ